MAGKWIQKMALKKGKLHSALGVTQGEKIPMEKLQKAKNAGGKLAKMANFAITAKSFKHK